MAAVRSTKTPQSMFKASYCSTYVQGYGHPRAERVQLRLNQHNLETSSDGAASLRSSSHRSEKGAEHQGDFQKVPEPQHQRCLPPLIVTPAKANGSTLPVRPTLMPPTKHTRSGSPTGGHTRPTSPNGCGSTQPNYTPAEPPNRQPRKPAINY
jgi:hypothetical protein